MDADDEVAKVVDNQMERYRAGTDPNELGADPGDEDKEDDEDEGSSSDDDEGGSSDEEELEGPLMRGVPKTKNAISDLDNQSLIVEDGEPAVDNDVIVFPRQTGLRRWISSDLEITEPISVPEALAIIAPVVPDHSIEDAPRQPPTIQKGNPAELFAFHHSEGSFHNDPSYMPPGSVACPLRGREWDKGSRTKRKRNIMRKKALGRTGKERAVTSSSEDESARPAKRGKVKPATRSSTNKERGSQRKAEVPDIEGEEVTPDSEPDNAPGPSTSKVIELPDLLGYFNKMADPNISISDVMQIQDDISRAKAQVVMELMVITDMVNMRQVYMKKIAKWAENKAAELLNDGESGEL